MHRYWLGEAVYVAEMIDSIIFLDLKSGRYSALSHENADAIKCYVRNWPAMSSTLQINVVEESSAVLLNRLVGEGLLTQEPPMSDSKSTELPKATLTAHYSPYVRKTCPSKSKQFLIVMRFCIAYCSAGFLFRFSTMKTSIDRLRKQKKKFMCRSSKAGAVDLSTLMSYFALFRAFTYTSRNRCVLDSLVLFDFLLRNGKTPTLVIGVQTRPFGAHCWVQKGDRVLNAPVELTLSYRTILHV